jgi:CubicO group peptidase (beta-lactamase class C family)
MKYLPVLFLLSACSEAIYPVTSKDKVWRPSNTSAFEHRLEKLRREYHIPSLSVGIVNGHKIAWYKGLGYADLENKIAPDTNTVYHIASVTKTFGSIILMQQVEAGRVNLNDPINKYGVKLGGRYSNDPRIKVKHLLTHTAQGAGWNWYNAGLSFRYNGAWYGELGKVIQQASGHSFGELVMQNIINPLQLKHTAPSLDDSVNFALTGYNRNEFAKQVAKPYNWQGHQLAPLKFKYGFSPAAGLMSSVGDLAVYSVAIDEELFLKPATWEKTFKPFRSALLKELPYGLGWFVGVYDGIKVMYHTGWWYGYSALFVKVPDKDLTFIILANSQDLSRPFYLTMYPVPAPWFGLSLNKDLMVSDFAMAFWEFFVR